MKKKIFLVMLIAMIACSQIFAATTIKNGSGTELDISFVIKFVKMAIILSGLLLLVKATIDIIHAVRNADQDPNGIKKVISNTLLYAIILGGFYVLITVIFASNDKGAESTISVDGLKDANAGDGFIKGLTGALVQL